MIEAKVQPIGRELDVAIASWLGPPARAGALVELAREIFAETDAQNASAVGQVLKYTTIVDGIRNASIERVKPEGVITRTYDVLPVMFMQIGQLLWDHSPVKTGTYQRSHRLLADGLEIAEVRNGWTVPPLPDGVREFIFAPTVPYARPLEGGWSKQAPDGVYQVVAVMAQSIFGKFAKVSFGYREIAGLAESRRERHARPGAPRDMRQPVIVMQPI